MITLHDAISLLNSSIVTIRGDVAYDADDNVVEYDKSLAQAKLVELQAVEDTQQQAEISAKQSAISKLAALGLTTAEVTALLGVQ